MTKVTKGKASSERGRTKNTNITIREIRQKFQKPKDQEAIMAWYIHRRISPFITWILARTHVTPNAVTWSMFVFGIVGGVLLSTKSTLMAFLGALAFQVLYLLDCVDGELARVTKRFSPAGEPLDHVMHYVTETALFVGTGMGLFFRTGEVFLLYVMLTLMLAHLFHRASIDILFQIFPNSRKEIQKVIQAGKINPLIKWIGFFSRTDSIYTLLVLILGFDLIFTPFPHPWGVTTFYYLGVTTLIVAKALLRIRRFYRLAKQAAKTPPR